MDPLPAYVAVSRWVTGLRVGVVTPASAAGIDVLAAAGARAVERVAFGPDDTIASKFDLLVCHEAWLELEPNRRVEVAAAARKALEPDGALVVWLPYRDENDFWSLVAPLERSFVRLQLVAQLPWTGISFAPVVEPGDAEPALTLRETLLPEVPRPSHYLVVASQGGATQRFRECVLVPLPARDPDPAEPAVVEPTPVDDGVRVELEEVRALLERSEADTARLTVELRARETDLAVLERKADDQDRAVARATAKSESLRQELETKAAVVEQAHRQQQATAAERAEIGRQLELALIEREGARQLLARTETDLQLARERATVHERQLAGKIEEASRLAGELQALRERAERQETLLQQSQHRAETLSASAAQGAEQGRALADVALDRDRLREELARRSTQIQALEDRLWQSQEDVQRARVDHVRATAEAERVRDALERSQASEQELRRQLEGLGAELRRLEVESGQARTTVRARESELAQLRNDLRAMTSTSADVQSLREELGQRGRQLAELAAELEQARLRENEARTTADRRTRELEAAGQDLHKLRRNAEETSRMASGLQNDLDTKQVELERLAAGIGNLQALVESSRNRARKYEETELELQRRLEQSAAKQELLRRQLREREQELSELVSTHESTGMELYELRRELESTARANEQLERALKLDADGSEDDLGGFETAGWPSDALAELRRLRAQLAAQARRHSEQLAHRDELARQSSDLGERERVRRLQIEIDVRAEEQEHMLARLDSSEQQIWEMNDMADRNAARLAAGLAQLEHHKELLEETREELEVTRRLLAAEQARALEQERLLASERAKLARAGIGPGGLPTAVVGPPEEIDGLFTEPGGEMVDLSVPMEPLPLDRTEELRPRTMPSVRPAKPPARADDGAGALHASASTSGARVLVEPIDDADDDWPTESVVALPSAAGLDGRTRTP